jgi:hypothetical protein
MNSPGTVCFCVVRPTLIVAPIDFQSLLPPEGTEPFQAENSPAKEVL